MILTGKVPGLLGGVISQARTSNGNGTAGGGGAWGV